MKNDQIELADVVRRFQHEYVAHFGRLMMPSQRKALHDIAACMTDARCVIGLRPGRRNSCRATTTTSSPRSLKKRVICSCPMTGKRGASAGASPRPRAIGHETVCPDRPTIQPSARRQPGSSNAFLRTVGTRPGVPAP